MHRSRVLGFESNDSLQAKHSKACRKEEKTSSDEEKEQAVHELELESRIIVVREQDHPILKGKIKRIFLADSL